jgi:hypothetical protein
MIPVVANENATEQPEYRTNIANQPIPLKPKVASAFGPRPNATFPFVPTPLPIFERHSSGRHIGPLDSKYRTVVIGIVLTIT